MSSEGFSPCPSPITLQRIASARWTPYVAATWQNWTREALAAEDACGQLRASDCEACLTLQAINTLDWSDTLGQRIQQAAREALGLHSLPGRLKRGTVCASA
ncbi:MAG TPA: hypothetical protein VFN25_13255 [Dokdonella sp.]|uniref:hypothetical protein n=1 Tax=Dokdonella sp. TaxID=2291710 RepID=UPI002D7F348B|nr:hypothetical protein [Dokdonella sp.]HET9033856.1 hypothetical protein [Dokdonella sp.]